MRDLLFQLVTTLIAAGALMLMRAIGKRQQNKLVAEALEFVTGLAATIVLDLSRDAAKLKSRQGGWSEADKREIKARAIAHLKSAGGTMLDVVTAHMAGNSDRFLASLIEAEVQKLNQWSAFPIATPEKGAN